MKEYKYDIAISLCSQDVEFAKNLVACINPSLKVFFYEDMQKELIMKSAPEVFSKAFKEDSRLVVVLSRKEWGESPATKIERDSIAGRMYLENGGYDFIFMIPMLPDQIPSWYPPIKIYANPRKNTVEQLASFIEFKVVEMGGTVKPTSFEDNLDQFQERLEKKRERIKFLCYPDSITPCRNEISSFIKYFNHKLDNIEKRSLPFKITRQLLNDLDHYSDNGTLGFNNLYFFIEIENNSDMVGRRIVSSQCYRLHLSIVLSGIIEGRDVNKTIKQEFYKFNSDINSCQGWSVMKFFGNESGTEKAKYLFADQATRKHYDLESIISSEQLIENWFIELYRLAEQEFKSII